MKIAIVDDQKNETQELIGLLDSWGKENDATLEIWTFKSGEEFLKAFKPRAFNLVFMDIYMGGISGIEAAKRMRKNDSQCLLVFLTSSADHAWDAFPLQTFDYLLKPCEPKALNRVLKAAIKQVPSNDKLITFTVGREKRSIPAGSLIWALSDNHHVQLSIVGEKHPVRAYLSFKKLQESIGDDSRFLVPNRGVLINMEHVTRLNNNEFIMRDGVHHPLRQNNQQVIKQAYRDFQLKKLESM